MDSRLASRPGTGHELTDGCKGGTSKARVQPQRLLSDGIVIGKTGKRDESILDVALRRRTVTRVVVKHRGYGVEFGAPTMRIGRQAAQRVPRSGATIRCKGSNKANRAER